MQFILDKDISSKIERIVLGLEFAHIKAGNVVCFRSFGSKSRAVARIWSLPRIWQMALNKKPYYCLEVIAEKFDKLSNEDKEKVLIHELLHIPKNFSGSLLSHNHNGRRIDRKVVEVYYQHYLKNRR